MQNKILGWSKFMVFRDVFSIQADSLFISELEKILKSGNHAWIEPSIKVERNNIFPYRFNIWYKAPHFETCYRNLLHLCRIVEQHYDAKLDLSLLEFVSKSLMIEDNCHSVVFGSDLRDDVADSRLKFWILLKDGISDRVVKLIISRFTLDVEPFFYDKIVLIGVDIGFANKSRLKFYPYFKSCTDDLQSVLSISKEQRTVMDLSGGFHFELLGKEITISPRMSGVSLTNIIQTPSVFNLEPFRYYVVSFLMSELSVGRIHNYNIYF